MTKRWQCNFQWNWTRWSVILSFRIHLVKLHHSSFLGFENKFKELFLFHILLILVHWKRNSSNNENMNLGHRETLEMPLADYFHLSRQGQNNHFWWGVLFVIFSQITNNFVEELMINNTVIYKYHLIIQFNISKYVTFLWR